MGEKIRVVKPLVSTLIAFVLFHCFHHRDVRMVLCLFLRGTTAVISSC